jgi:ethanolamine permease
VSEIGEFISVKGSTSKVGFHFKMRVEPLSPEQSDSDYKISRIDATCLGLVIVLGGFYSSWNTALSAGLGSCLLAFFLVGVAYFRMCVCISTVSSVIPFSGGGYGLARCSLGFYPGFVVGCCDFLQYMIFLSLFAEYVSQYTCTLFPGASSVRALIWSMVIVTSLVIQLNFSRRMMYRFVVGMAVVQLAALCIFCFGSFKYMNFYGYALVLRDVETTASAQVICDNSPVINRHAWFVHGFSNFISILPVPAMIFMGAEALSMAANETRYPKLDVPYAQMWVMRITLLFALVVVILVASISPGTQCMSLQLAPLNPGLLLIFNGNKALVWLASMPAVFTASFGFMWAYSKMIKALSDSSFLPRFTVTTHKGIQSRIEYKAPLIAGALPCIVINICLEIYGDSGLLLNLGLLFALIAYCAQCIGYLFVSNKEGVNMITDSSFKRAGAVYAIFIWVLMAVGILGFQDKDHYTLLALGVCLVVMTSFYYGYGKRKQTLSNEEKKYLYAMHLLNCKPNYYCLGILC